MAKERKDTRERRDTPSGANQFSVYAQRDTDSVQVDWGVIAKDISDEVTKISDERQTKRDELATSQRNTLNELSQVADLDNQSVNNFVIRGGDFSKNAMMTQYELMTRGKIKPREYQLFQQSVKDGYKNLSIFAKNADDKYKAAMERLKNGEDGNQIASELEIVFNEGTFDYTDLKNKQLITNPSTGEMLIVTLQEGKDGKMVIPDLKKNPEMYQSLATLNNRTAFQLDRRDTGKLTTAAVADLGDVVISTISDYTVLGGGGVVGKTTGIRQAWDSSLMNEPGAYDKWMSDSVDVIAGKRDNPNNFNAMQVLTNTGVKLSLKDEPGTIQYKTNGNGMPELMMTPEQIDQARDIVQKQIESKLIQKIEFTKGMSGQQVSASKAKAADDKKKDDATNAQNLKMLGNIFRGKTEAELKTALEHFRDQNTGIQNVDKTAEGVRVTFKIDGEKQTRDITMNGKTFEQFVDSAANLLTGKDIDKTNMTGGNDTEISTIYGSSGIVDKTDDFDMEVLDKKLNKKIDVLDFYTKDEGEGKPNPNYNPEEDESDDNPKMILPLRKSIVKAFKDDFELTIQAVGDDKFKILAAGYNTPDFIFEGDFFDIFGNDYEGDTEKQRLKDFMRELYIQKFEKEKAKKSSTDFDYTRL